MNNTYRLSLAAGIAALFMGMELTGGLLSHSLAILTDALHLLSDVAGILINLVAVVVARKPSTKMMSWGFYRIEVMGALLSIFLIWGLTGGLLFVAIHRLQHTAPVIDAQIMLLTACLGICVNVVLFFVLGGWGHCAGHGGHSHGLSLGHSHGGHDHDHAHIPIVHPSSPTEEEDEEYGGGGGDNMHTHTGQPSNINIRATFIHILGDFLQSVGVVVSAALILWRPTWAVLDPVCTFVFSFIVLCTTLPIFKESILILMESTPSWLDSEAIVQSLLKLESVEDVHDFHLWSIGAGRAALSGHLVIASNTELNSVLCEAQEVLKHQFNIDYTTLQLESPPLKGTALPCDHFPV
eukprot:NODE_2546_length_1151_cov_15.873047_g2427_i0.p1 GENE.NODE_2546_length_1151_cov_15.873047_g2427_i0~~NODE_2546_length_1151_cov_15.873047_g2427_i0.p1  ORF type:complete len:361 (+),score=87.20 NODE_2546_length_1151_cov_15.873047_g2427_i0:29-1084(+)